MNEIFEEILNRITLNKVLITILIFLGLIICSTTLAVVTKGKSPSQVRAMPQSPLQEKSLSYKELGRMRATTLPEKNAKNGINLVINPLLSYTMDDQDFYEELARKNSKIKAIFINYFSTKTRSELKNKGEKGIKEDLLSEINEILVLNKIQDIYFSDLIFLD